MLPFCLQVDGLADDQNIDELHSVMNTYGTVIDYEQNQGGGGVSVRFQ